jgi:hypothetical protein
MLDSRHDFPHPEQHAASIPFLHIFCLQNTFDCNDWRWQDVTSSTSAWPPPPLFNPSWATRLPATRVSYLITPWRSLETDYSSSSPETFHETFLSNTRRGEHILSNNPSYSARKREENSITLQASGYVCEYVSRGRRINTSQRCHRHVARNEQLTLPSNCLGSNVSTKKDCTRRIQEF